MQTPSDSEAEDAHEHEAQDQPGPEQADDAEDEESAPGQDRYLWLQECAEDRLKTMNTEVKVQHDLFKAGDGGLRFRHAPKCAAESHKVTTTEEEVATLAHVWFPLDRCGPFSAAAALADSLTHPLTHPLVHSPRSLTHALTHSLTHPLARADSLTRSLIAH
jgi:hypothetical protein